MSGFDPMTQSSDHVYFVGEPTPGVAHIESNSGSPRKWQERGGFGLSGATVCFTGIGLAKFDVILTLYTPDHYQAWEAYLVKNLPPPNTQNPKAVGIFHPLLRPFNINACVIEDVSVPKQVQDGVWQVVIACKEWRKPKLTFATPDGAKSTPNDPNAAAKAQIDANRALLAAQREALAK